MHVALFPWGDSPNLAFLSSYYSKDKQVRIECLQSEKKYVKWVQSIRDLSFFQDNLKDTWFCCTVLFFVIRKKDNVPHLEVLFFLGSGLEAREGSYVGLIGNTLKGRRRSMLLWTELFCTWNAYLDIRSHCKGIKNGLFRNGSHSHI